MTASTARLFLAALAVCLISSTAFAQYNSTVQGVVTDASGAVVPGATVRVTNIATGVGREAVTTEEGFYRALNLGPGTYRVTSEHAGFRPGSRDNVPLAASETARVDIVLQIGELTESVSVSGRASQVETEQGRVSGVIEHRQLTDLPIAARNIYSLVAVQPGITGRALSSSGGLDGNSNIGIGVLVRANANGGRTESNNFTVDDASVNSTADGGTSRLSPSPEAVEEVRVTTNNFSAVDGRNSGAQVQVVTKGGTNQFHGVVLEDFQNNTLSTRNVFEKAVPVYRKNQFGYNIGGPIKKNRTFFFHSFEALRGSGGRGTVATVETQDFRDFVLRTRPGTIAAKLLNDFRPWAYPTSGLIDIGSPLKGVNVNDSKPDGIFDYGSVNYVPAALRTGEQYSLRIDHELRPGKDRLYGNYFYTPSTQLAGGVRVAFDRPQYNKTHYIGLNYTHILDVNKVNEFRAGMMRGAGLFATPIHLEVPTIQLNPISGFGDPGARYPGGYFQTEFTYKDVLSWIRNRHGWKMGFELKRTRSNSINSDRYIPLYAFSGPLDFVDDEALTMTRKVDPRTGDPSTNVVGLRDWEWSLFVNDDWKVTRNLTINYGLRYDNYGTPVEVNDLLRNIVYTTGNMFSERIANAKVDRVKQFFPTPGPLFAPRFGFAWNPDGKGKTAVRGGYGLSYDRLFYTPILNFRNNPPLRADAILGTPYKTSFTYSLGDPSKPFLGYPVDAALRLGLDPRNGIVGARVSLDAVIQPDLGQPYAHNWFLGVQRDIGLGIVIEANYLGSAGHKLLTFSNVNRFVGDMLPDVSKGETAGSFTGYNPSFSTMFLSQSASNSIYHGGTLQARRTFRGGFSLNGAYTYGKVITDADTYINSTPFMDSNNRRLDRSLAAFDTPRRLSIVGIWEVPFLRRNKDLAGKLLGGWQLSGLAILEAGNPINITNEANPGGDFNKDNSGADRPNAPAESVKRSGFARSDYQLGIFARGDFPTPIAGTNGKLGRNVFRGPGYAQVDMSVMKKFGITERISSEVRVDAYNALNRVNLSNVITDLNNASSFGKSTTATTPRAFQVGLRVRF